MAVRRILEVREGTTGIDLAAFDLRPIGVATSDADGREAVALEVDVGPGVLVHDDERDRRELREPIGFLHRDRRPPAPWIGILRVLVVLPAPIAPLPERLRSYIR